MYRDETPIAAPATALLPSALSVIRCSGEKSIELVSRIFRPAEALRGAPGNTIHHGKLCSHSGEVVDEVMAAVFRAPLSYTGEESVEIFGHGSPAGIRRVLTALYEVGFREAAPGEFTRRAFLNGKLDLTRAEAINDLVSSQTLEAHRLAVDRLGGGVHAAVMAIRSDLVSLMAQISIQLDYPEEDTPDVVVDAGLLARCAAGLTELAESFSRGRLVQEGVSIALAGRTNAGKSSLFNTLLQQDRSIVSDLPGTTRDYLEATVDIGGIPVRLYDTAGLRPDGTEGDHEPVEAEGIRRSHTVIAASDLVLFVLDAAAGMTDEDTRRIDEIRLHTPVVPVWNKTDLVQSAGQGAGKPPGGAVPVSALNGEGIGLLNRRVVEEVSAAHAVVGKASGSVVIDSARQFHLLTRAVESVGLTLRSLEQGMPVDVLAVDLQDALGAIGEITGEVVTEEILDEMFGSFCVGK